MLYAVEEPETTVGRTAPDLDRLLADLTSEERSTIAFLDLQKLKVEQANLSRGAAAALTEPTYGVVACLRMWTLVVERMEHEWSGVDYHMVYEYLNELTVRDTIDNFVEAMPASLARKVNRVLAAVDRRFKAVTTEDGGSELAQYWRPLAEGSETRWWWTRKPTILPPGW